VIPTLVGNAAACPANREFQVVCISSHSRAQARLFETQHYQQALPAGRYGNPDKSVPSEWAVLAVRRAALAAAALRTLVFFQWTALS